MKSRRIPLFLLSAALLILLASCGTQEENVPEPASSPLPAEQTEAPSEPTDLEEDPASVSDAELPPENEPAEAAAEEVPPEQAAESETFS